MEISLRSHAAFGAHSHRVALEENGQSHLSRIPPRAVSVGQLLDFFENAPYLEEVKLCFVIPTTGAQNGQ